MSPYCDHPECHNANTTDYLSGLGGNGPVQRQVTVIHWGGGYYPRREGWRRWCRSHALIFEGVAFG